VCNHPSSCERGTYDDVRNRNGKNSRKLVFTAAGLPVFRAMAYPNPAKARLHAAAMRMKTSTPSRPVSNRTPRMKPRTMIGNVRQQATATSAAM
jgi:hypothetical protein